ncbi:hypothetical protein [Selenomonas sp. FC4001]|uniref:PglD-related sugar-binding protein n=1 Tax=Selenomonas sp. FC4001 TaxID=1408313 RepID=UPI000B1054AA|nr:hypothetical protein [Selenomonas sp. FC4001]
MEDIVLVGFGGHAKSVADCIEREGKYHIAGYTDVKLQVIGTDIWELMMRLKLFLLEV